MAGYTPVFDFILEKYKMGQHSGARGLSGYSIASVFGMVYRYCGMDKRDPRCEAAADKIAMRMGVSGATVRASLQILTTDGWLLRTGRAGTTPVYRLSPKSRLELKEIAKNSKEETVIPDIVEVRDGPG